MYYYNIEVCHQVQVEPELQAMSDPCAFSHATANTQEGARLDIAMNGFWGGVFCGCTYFQSLCSIQCWLHDYSL